MVTAEDSLDALAAQVGELASNILGANCLPLDTFVITGDVLYLPLSTAATATPDGTIEQWSPTGCTNSMLANIVSPGAGETLTAATPIVGTAFASTFAGYRLEVREDNAATYEVVRELQVPAIGSVLGTIDLSDQDAGLYWIRLVVNTGAEQIENDAVCVIPVFVP